jgi:hypothetical protein
VRTLSSDTSVKRHLYEYLPACISSPTQAVVETIEIGSKVGAVVGRGGANIKRIEAESGANLTVPKDLEGPTVCQIRGEPEAAAKAGKLVRLYMEHGGPPPEATQTVDLLRCEAQGC